MGSDSFDEFMRRNKEALQRLKEATDGLWRDHVQEQPEAQSITVNKRSHRIRFEGETEDVVTLIIEPKPPEDRGPRKR
ncbi:MAG TPA: hypothetical protein VGV38_22445 [Pyrinomonadaceae bacterium]|nr:hypothetical protein [Pyrinomonadaceae bacterium]